MRTRLGNLSAVLATAVAVALAPLAAGKVAVLIHADVVHSCDEEGMIVSMPKRSHGPLRRAA